MCGKFTARKHWVHVTDPRALAERIEKQGDDPLARAQSDCVTYRVMNNLPVIVWNRVVGKRQVAPMRWGFPHPQDWKKPQPIHARAETIETTRAFADAFRDGQRGLVLMRDFNEAPDIEGPTRQHVITPDEKMLAACVVWRRFDADDAGAPLFACCLVTVAANALIAGLPASRMPAFLADGDWDIWLGEKPADTAHIKACLRTRDGARWTMTPEEKREKNRRGKSAISDPGGLFGAR